MRLLKLLLAIGCFFFAALFLAAGLDPVFNPSDKVISGSVGILNQGEPPESEYLEVSGGVLVSPDRVAGHVVGGHAYLPVLTPGEAMAMVPTTGFDLTKAEVREPARRFVARVSLDDFQKALTEGESKGLAGMGSRIHVPMDVKGTVEDFEEWPLDAQQLITQTYGIPQAQVVCIEHGEEPFGVNVVIGGVVCSLVSLLIGRWLLRSRRRDLERAKQPSSSGGFEFPQLPDLADSGCLGKLGAVVGAGLMIAFGAAKSCGDNVGRGVRGLNSGGVVRGIDPATLKNSDDLAGDLAEHVVEALSHTQKAQQLYSVLQDTYGVDFVLEGFIVEAESFAHYERDAAGTFRVVETSRLSYSRSFINGEDTGIEKEIDDDLPDPAKGEYEWFRLIAPGPLDVGPRMAIESAGVVTGGPLVQEDYTAELEFVRGSWAEHIAGKEVVLQFSARGLEEQEQALLGAVRRVLAPIEGELRRRSGMDRVEVDIEVSENGNSTITIGPSGATFRAVGPTVYRTVMKGWKD